MSAIAGPNLVTNGLVAYLDAANRNSQIGAVTTSLINTNSWTVSSGSVSGYNQNGSTDENVRSYDTDPWGGQSLVWGTFANGTAADDGGWNTDYVTIDRTKLYRFSVWVRRTSATSAGTFYFGTNSDGGVFSTADGLVKGNPYWDCSSTGVLTQNQWYLVCGHIYPSDTSYTGNNPDSGYFTVAGGTTKVRSLNYCNIVSDLKWGPTSTTAQHRTYHYYSADATTRLQFAWPRIDVCDGNQPSISELLTHSPSIWYDLSGLGNNGTLYTSPINTGTVMQFNTGNYALIPSINYSSGTYTVMGAARYSGATRGRIISTGSNNWLMGHWSGTTQNYYAEGWVSDVGAGANDTNWRILAASGNSSADSWQMYVNGTQTYSNSNGSAGPNQIQINGVGVSERSDSECAFVMVYNRVLTPAEVLQNFNALKGRFNL